MPLCCAYREMDGPGVAIACYERKECPEIPGLELVTSKNVADCAECFHEAAGEEDKKKYRIGTDKPTLHPIIGGPEVLVPEEPCPDGQWVLVDVIWIANAKRVCDKWIFGVICVRYHYECLYSYTAIWRCSATGATINKVKFETRRGPCRTFG